MTFDETYQAAYGFSDPSIDIGHVLREGSPTAELPVVAAATRNVS